MKILDFGLARLGSSEMTRTGTVMGTPHYMSPEQVLGDKVDLSSDVFSIGAVFYELLCNHKPFDGDSAHAVLFQVVNKQPESVRKWTPDLPPILVELVEKAMVKDRSKRFQSAGVLREALARARRAIREGRATSTLEAEGVLGIAAPKSASDSFKSLSPKTSPPIPSNQQFASASSAPDSGRPRSSPPAVGSQVPAPGRPSRGPAESARVLGAPDSRSRETTRRGCPCIPIAAAAGSPMPGRTSVVRSLVGFLPWSWHWIGAFLLLRQRPTTPSPRLLPDTQVGRLTRHVVHAVELASGLATDTRRQLHQADRALKLAPGQYTAQQGRQRSEHLKTWTAGQRARARFDAVDRMPLGRLGRVLAIDPRIRGQDLSARLDRSYQSQAEQHVATSAGARDQAERALARPRMPSLRPTSAARDAEAPGERTLPLRHSFFRSPDSFDRARRAAETSSGGREARFTTRGRGAVASVLGLSRPLAPARS